VHLLAAGAGAHDPTYLSGWHRLQPGRGAQPVCKRQPSSPWFPAAGDHHQKGPLTTHDQHEGADAEMGRESLGSGIMTGSIWSH